MKKHTIIALCLALTACGGGTGATGPQGQPGAPGLSAYEIWLNAGNTGTEQDFLDSLVKKNESGDNYVAPSHLKNTHEYLEYYTYYYPSYSSKVTETEMSWDKHNGYKQYIHEYEVQSNATEYRHTCIYNEKELKLANYGVSRDSVWTDFNSAPWYPQIAAYVHNREGDGANIYTPEKDSVFIGGTLAYLSHGANDTNPTLIKGDSKFTYAPNNPSKPTSLELAFDNWYNLTFSKSASGGLNVNIAGSNNTNNETYTINTGELHTASGTTKPSLSYNHVNKDNIEETVGTYSVHFSDDFYSRDTYLNGAFGGTKQ